MKVIKFLTLIILFFAAASFVQADILIDSYVAQISKADKYNSRGQRLQSVAAILRQDRANFHLGRNRDALDQSDSFFHSYSNRNALEKLLERGWASPGFYSAIKNGYPLALVQIFQSNAGYYYVRVTLAN